MQLIQFASSGVPPFSHCNPHTEATKKVCTIFHRGIGYRNDVSVSQVTVILLVMISYLTKEITHKTQLIEDFSMQSDTLLFYIAFEYQDS